jgi:hypothetical protein
MTSGTADAELLQAFEPIVRYNRGENFYPMAVEGYLAACDLLMGSSERSSRVVLEVGQVTPDRLATFQAEPGTSLYLRYVQRPMTGIELARWRARPGREVLHAPARLARVGLFGRLVDAGFDASLVLRGTVPGGTAAAAEKKYQAVRQRDSRYVYYGRVIRRNDWIVLHYLYFYAMNDYRSSVHGVNDHEADWEQVFVYLEDRPEGPRPVWIAAAAHDYVGDQLRRRWDDPQLTKQGEHPVINAGAGSHASYFEVGEYLTSVPLAAVRGVAGVLSAAREFWVRTLRQPDPGDLAGKLQDALSASFVDYARGDGLAIGPGQGASWTPVLISDADPWVDGYRGLFGLDTYDRFGGERSPAGPKYNRNGTQRLGWYDPLGFAGLDKAAPPFRWPVVLREQEEALREEGAALDATIAGKVSLLPGLQLEVQGLGQDAGFARQLETRERQLRDSEAELLELRRQRAAIDDRAASIRRELASIEAGNLGDPHAHLTHPHRPVPPEDTRYGLLVEVWSAVSVSLLLLLLAAIVFLDRAPWWVALLLAIGGYVVLEAGFRRRLTRLTLVGVLILAGISAVILAWELREGFILATLVGLALFLLSDNIRELLGR